MAHVTAVTSGAHQAPARNGGKEESSECRDLAPGPRVSVVIPTLKEAPNLPHVLSRLPDSKFANESTLRADDNTSRPVLANAPDPSGSRAQLSPGSRVIGYVTIDEDSDPGTAGQSSAAIESICQRSNWSLLSVIRDRGNRRILERPGLRHALKRIAEGDADGLVVSDLGLSGSIVDLGALMAWFRDAHATLIALDLGIDTSTREGDYAAATLGVLSARAQERIATRTRRSAGEGGANGRPAVSDHPQLMERIATMRAAKMSLQAIADQLNAEGVPTLRGGTKWRPSSIQAALGYRRPGPREHLPAPTRHRA